MPRRSQLKNDYYSEMLAVGPFGGIDPTTAPFFVTSPNLVDALNFVPNLQYGGYATVEGRIATLSALLPSSPNGITKMERPGQPDVYIFAVDNAGHGELWAGVLGGAPAALVLPEVLTAGQQTYFAAADKWIFVTNGVDRPLKIDTALAVTYWGIVAPTPAPTAVESGAGVLLGRYYYCETFSNDAQESSQGAISAPLDLIAEQASSTFTITGAPTAGDGVALSINDIPTAIVVTAGQTTDEVAAALAAAVNANSAIASSVVATVVDNVGTITALAPGIAGNGFSLQGAVSGGAGTVIAPTAVTFFAGGTAGQSATITPTATTTDPQVTTRNLYRLGGSLGQWRLVHSQPIADLTPYLDDEADDLVVGAQLVIDRDPPPPFTYIATHQERVWGIVAATSELWWSNYGEPWGYNAAANTVPVGQNSFGDDAMGLRPVSSVLLVVKRRSVYGMYGTSDVDFDTGLVQITSLQGCIAPRSICGDGDSAAWLSMQGVMVFGGSGRQNISDGAYQQSNIKAILDAMAASDKAQCVGFCYDRGYYFSFPPLNRTYLFDPRTPGWFPLGYATSQVYYDLESDVPVVAMNLETAGQIDRWFAPDAVGDLGEAIEAFILSGVSDTGSIGAHKVYPFAFVEAPLQPDAVLNVAVAVDPGSGIVPWTQAIDLGEGAPRHRVELPFGTNGTQVQMRLQTIATRRVVLQKAAVYGRVDRLYKPESPSSG